MTKFLTQKKEGGKKMKKLFYIKLTERSRFDTLPEYYLLDVCDTYLKAQELKKYYESDAHKLLDIIKIQFSMPELAKPIITNFNQDRMKKFLSLTKEAA